MITYLIKIVLCSALFVLFYKAVLERESMHRFNRCYLLGSLAFSIIIPLLTFNQYVSHFPVVENIVTETVIFTETGSHEQAPNNGIQYQTIIFLTIYVTIATMLSFRFAINLKALLHRAWTNTTIPFKNSKIVLIDQDVTPHSFLDYIFVNRKAYKSGGIQQEIFIHELAHVKQKNSWDILFFEIMQIFCWFNPVLFLYRRAILLNHEFLADQEVINKNTDVRAYQLLLFEKVSQQASSCISSQFNYSITKQRLIMMTTPKSFRKSLCKQLAIIPVLGISLCLFSTKIVAQETSETTKPKQMEVQSTKDGITDKHLSEFNDLVDKVKNEKGRPEFNKLSQQERKKLETLYLGMSEAQQKNHQVKLMPMPEPLPKSIPTQHQIESWKEADMYGVWIDGKRIANSDLNNYSHTDFAQLFVSKLEKNAKNYGKHYFQVNLMTIDYYDAYLKRGQENKEKYLIGYRMDKN